MCKKCKTCTHWSPVEEYEGDPLGTCAHPKINGTDPNTVDALFVGTVDDHAVVLVGQDFGCVHHEEAQRT